MSFRSLTVFIAVCCSVPAATAQTFYGKYLEPPSGKVLQGIGHYADENADYLSMLSGVNMPATKAIAANIGKATLPIHQYPSVAQVKEALCDLGVGVIPQIDMAMRDSTIMSGALPYFPITIDESIASGSYVTPPQGTITLSAQPADGNTITLSDGVTSKTYEFDSNSSVIGGNVSVTIGGSVAAAVANLTAAIVASGQTIWVEGPPAPPLLKLVNAVGGGVGNVAITKVGSTITVDGMSGGGDVINTDLLIETWGQALVAYGKPCMMRIGFEFNNSAGYHDHAYVEAYRHIVDGIRKQGATNVAYVWCWEPSGDDDYWDGVVVDAPKWYPGNDYVDWWGIDMFTYSTYFAPTATTAMKAAAFLAKADQEGFPVAAMEVSPGALDITASNGQTCIDTWFEPFFEWLAANPGVKQFCWVNHDYDNTPQGAALGGWGTHYLEINTDVFTYWTGQISYGKYISAGELDQLNGYQGWWDLGHALAGTSGIEPRLAGDGDVVPSGAFTLRLVDAKPNAVTGLFVGLHRIDAPFKGGILVPDTYAIFALTTNATGGITLGGGTWLSTATTGFTSYYQFWITDAGGPHGFSASNAIMAVTL